MKANISHTPGTVGPLLRLVWPVLVEQLLVLLVGFSDTLLAGHYLEEQHLAAMTVINYVLWMLTNCFSFVSIGAIAMIARFVGANDSAMARRVQNQALVLGIIFATVFTTVGLIWGDRLAGLLQLEGEPAALASRYLRIVIPLLPAMMLEAISNGALRGAGNMVTPLVSMIMVNVVNIAVGWSLLLGLGPLPELGWDALPIGAACGHLTGGLLPFFILCYGRAGLKYQRSLMRPDRPLMRRILRIGMPGGFDVLAIIVLQLAFLSLVDKLGPLAAAAHGVALRMESLAYLPGFAFQLASATLVGQYLGAGDRARASRVVLVACTVSGGLLTATALGLFFGSERLIGLFLGPQQADVAAIAPTLLRIVWFGLPPLALMQVLTGALRGAGDTRWPLAITFAGFLGVRLSLAWLLAYNLGFGVQGAWYAMVADLTFRTTLIAIRFLSGGWARVEV